MPNQVAWRLVSPMIMLSAALLLIGVFAARTVHVQQQQSSEAMAKEVESLIELENLYIDAREVRYRVNLFLRNQDAASLDASLAAISAFKEQLVKALPRRAMSEEQGLVSQANRGFEEFRQAYFGTLGFEIEGESPSVRRGEQKLGPDELAKVSRLADEVFTQEVLEPLQESIAANRVAVDETNTRNLEAARQLMYGFLLLGVCGGLAGILTGLGVGRALGNSMIQLSVSIRDAAVKLSDARGVITLTRHSDLQGLRTGVQSLAEDISHVVQQLQQRERELMQSERLGQLGQLAAGMAHELRNPLMPMKMLVEAALEQPQGGGLKGRSLEVIREEISRLESSIQSFLDFARPPRPEKTEQDLVKVIDDSLLLLKARAEKQGVEMLFVRQPEVIRCIVDKGQFCQLLLNLLLNSLDALPAGGQIGVELSLFHRMEKSKADALGQETDSQVESPRRLIKLGTGQSVDWIQLRVSDNGPGLEPEIAERIFEPFATTKETGMGLGLATCKRIVLAHGGRIDVSNREQGGTEFSIQLPASVS